MEIPAWLIAYSILLVLGVIVGLLLRFLLVLIVVAAALVLLAVWLLAFFDPGALGQLRSLVSGLFSGIALSPELLFTTGTLVFLGGVLGGVLLTTRLRGIEQPRPVS